MISHVQAGELLQNETEQLERLSADLDLWLAHHASARQSDRLAAIAANDELEFLRLRRITQQLSASSRTPVAAAVYGPSQVGKSLFVGQILTPRDDNRSPLGRDDQRSEPDYYSQLSFEVDLNPQSGSNEATALVTRFTTNARLPQDMPAGYPVLTRALTRSQLLRVMARGFSIECAAQGGDWTPEALSQAVAKLADRFAATEFNPAWRRDLLDAYSYMQSADPRRYMASETWLAQLLLQHRLSPEGYTALAAQLFWDSWRSLTGLFLRIDELVQQLNTSPHEPGLLLPWPAVRFLLDSKRATFHERRNSKCFPRVEWSDFNFTNRDGWHALEHRPGWGAGNEPLDLVQAAMLELVVPILPNNLRDDWQQVIERIDILDIPGLRAGRQGAEHGKRTTAETLDEQLEILKRGKVAYLFEHYTQELQIQTLLLLARGGNLEVTAQMKHHLNLWGSARFGSDWPSKLPAGLPALFLGLTGIDEEFRQRNEFADSRLYDTRLAQLADTLGNVMSDFGGPSRPFTNIYPIRYPGTWDATNALRAQEGTEKWERAGQAFLAAGLVKRHVAQPDQKWAAAMQDEDGGLSLISAGWRQVTSADQKHQLLRERVDRTRHDLLALARRWVVNADGNINRQQRQECAQVVVDWLKSDPRLIYERVAVLRQSLTFAEGEQYELSDFADRAADNRYERPDSLAARFPELLQAFWRHWSTTLVCDKYQQQQKSIAGRRDWLDVLEVARLADYLKDYFCSVDVFPVVKQQLWSVISLKLRDETAQREGRRRYVRILINDLVLRPGLSLTAPEAPSADEARQFGLMAPLVGRWSRELPAVLAAGAGAEVQVPAGNDELCQLLTPFGHT